MYNKELFYLTISKLMYYQFYFKTYQFYFYHVRPLSFLSFFKDLLNFFDACFKHHLHPTSNQTFLDKHLN